jgi:hypothetical protein
MNQRLAHILKSPWTTHIAFGAATFGAGAGLGYFLWGRAPQYEVAVEAEVPELSFDTDGLAQVMAARDPEEVAEADRIASEEGYDTAVVAPQTEAELVDNGVVVRPAAYGEAEDLEPVRVSVFDDGDWDWDKEQRERGDESKPYVLHRDEFYRNEFDYTQSDLTYYEGDNIMVDERNIPVMGFEKIVGELLWGHGSGQDTVVFVRNRERLGEYQIFRELGSYQIEVLNNGFEQEEAERDLRHSHSPRRFRPSD